MNEIPWSEIESQLSSLTAVSGGYSNATRGLLTLATGEKIFVKIGVDENTKGWASKEIKVYEFLKQHAFSFVPQLLSSNEAGTSFALEALLPEDSWDWTETWTSERLDATLAAMDALAAIKPSENYGELFAPVLTEAENGWPMITASQELNDALAVKLKGLNEENLLNDLSAHTERSLQFVIRHDTLVHDDVRTDNCAWNAVRGEVKLVDWNWLEMGDRRLDLAAMLTHVQNSGFDVLPKYAERLDADALHWMAGFWLANAAKPIWPGGPEKLREVQLRTGITALTLSKGI